MSKVGSTVEAETTIKSDAGSGFVALLVFTVLWNAVSFPVAVLLLPKIIRDGEWAGLFVLLFPLVGLGMLWGTIHSGVNLVRRGGARVHPQQLPPRLGSRFSGHVAFPRGVSGGQGFRAVLSCVPAGGGDTFAAHWSKDATVRVVDVGGNKRASFQFDTPDRLPGIDRDAVTDWRLELHEEGKTTATYAFPFRMQPPAGVEHLSEEDLRPGSMVGDDEDADLAPAGIPKALEGLANVIGRERIEKTIAAIPAEQRAKFHAHFAALPPGQQKLLEQAARYARRGSTIKKIFFWAIGLFIAFQVLGVVAVLLFSHV